jgi:hypothetical protein
MESLFMFTEHIKKHKWFYVTVLLCVLQIACNIIWIALNENFMGFDVFEHLTRQERFCIATNNIINSSTTSFYLKLKNTLSIFFDMPFMGFHYPGLVYLITVAQKLIFGTYYKLPFILNSFYLIVLIFSTYAIGSFCVNASVGCLAAFILSTSPQIAGIARYYGLDYPLMALVAASFLVLLKTDFFQNIAYVILLALLCVIGTLIKGQFVLFMIPAIFFVVIYAVRQKKTPLLRIASLFMTLLILIIVGTSIWHKGNLYNIVNIFYLNARGHYASIDGSVKSFISFIAYYPRTMSLTMFPFYFLLLVGALCHTLIYYSRLSERMKIILWFALITYVIFTILPNKVGRFLFPAYFSYALIISYVIEKASSARMRSIMISGIIIIGLLQVVTMSFGPNIVYVWIRNVFVDTVRPLNADNWAELPQESNVREQIQALEQKITKQAKVLIFPLEKAELPRTSEFEYFLSNARPDLLLSCAFEIGFEENRDNDLLSSDYIIFDAPSAIERALIGEEEGALPLYQVGWCRSLEKYKDKFVIVSVAEICSLYGETVHNVILAKKIS